MDQDKDGEDMGKEAWPMPHDQNLPLRLKNIHRQFDGKVLKKGNYGVKRDTKATPEGYSFPSSTDVCLFPFWHKF